MLATPQHSWPVSCLTTPTFDISPFTDFIAPILLELFELEDRMIFQTVAQDMFNSTLFSGLFKFSGISRSSSDLVMEADISFPHFQQLFLHLKTASNSSPAPNSGSSFWMKS